jgi:hypothetical protein
MNTFDCKSPLLFFHNRCAFTGHVACVMVSWSPINAEWLNCFHYAGQRRKVQILSMLFCVVTPCGLVGRYQRFGETYCFHLQGWYCAILPIDHSIYLHFTVLQIFRSSSLHCLYLETAAWQLPLYWPNSDTLLRVEIWNISEMLGKWEFFWKSTTYCIMWSFIIWIAISNIF